MRETELEVKIIGIEEEDLVQRILHCGGVFVCEEKQINVHFDSSIHALGGDKHLRIRSTKKDGVFQPVELTLKERLPSKNVRRNEEYTVLIDDAETGVLLLKKLGFDQIRYAEKRRKRYEIGDVRIEFDEWDKDTLSYPYAEIEAPSERVLKETLSLLEISEQWVSTKSIRELRAEEGKY